MYPVLLYTKYVDLTYAYRTDCGTASHRTYCTGVVIVCGGESAIESAGLSDFVGPFLRRPTDRIDGQGRQWRDVSGPGGHTACWYHRVEQGQPWHITNRPWQLADGTVRPAWIGRRTEVMERPWRGREGGLWDQARTEEGDSKWRKLRKG